MAICFIFVDKHGCIIETDVLLLFVNMIM